MNKPGRKYKKSPSIMTVKEILLLKIIKLFYYSLKNKKSRKPLGSS